MRQPQTAAINDLHAAMDALRRNGLPAERLPIWLRSRNGSLGGERPIDVIARSPGDVLDAAAAYGASELPMQEARDPLWVDAVIGANGDPLKPTDRNYRKLELTVRGISDELIQRLAADPTQMRQLHWHDFEQLVAELFERDGFEVTLTPTRGDRGVDLFAARRTGVGSVLYVVECKQHSQPIGPRFVRELAWVVDRHRANKGVLATTSRFTAGALREQDEMRFRMALADFEILQGWLRGAPIFG